MRVQHVLLTVMLTNLFSVAPIAWAAGGDHPSAEAAAANMPEPLRALVDRERWVGGHWVNWEDNLAYAGDTRSLNDFLSDLADTPDFFTVDKIYIHAGKGYYQPPWDRDDERTEVDWQVDIIDCAALGLKPEEHEIQTDRCSVIDRVDIYLGGQIQIEDLIVPDEFELVLKDMPLEPTPESAAIRNFADQHNADRANEQADKVD